MVAADDLMEESFRWFGPNDPVPLSHIRQSGASAVFTSLHEVPYGQCWPREAIRQRKAHLGAAGLRWTAVESVPVHESIKTGQGDLKTLFANYARTLEHLGAEGIHTVVYNFMPVLDWVRTDTRKVLPDGSICLKYDPVHFAAFDLHALRRRGAEADYTDAQREQAARWWRGLSESARDAFVQSIIDVFPGVKWGLTLDDIRSMLAAYHQIDGPTLSGHLTRFLEAVAPAAERAGVRLAIHPDDPPFPLLGLPRVVSTAAQLDAIFTAVDSPANGVCFCTGSLSARSDNDVPAMARRFASRIHAAHLRSTRHEADGSFFEADHLAGSVDIPAVMSELLSEQDRRRGAGRSDWQLAFRPDHGHTMMDDLSKTIETTPGYSCIGRMRGLAELRGVMHGLRYAQRVAKNR